MRQLAMYTPEIPWERLTAFPGNGQMKPLREEQAGKGKTLLVRLPAGGRIEPHTHSGAVQHFILEGECECEGKIYGAGTYRLMPPHEDVPVVTTQNGVTILMVWDPVS